MKQLIILSAFICIVLIPSSCKKEDNSASTEMKHVVLTTKQKQLISKSNAFGFDFFKKVNSISGSKTNLMVSPLSVSMALGMTRNGAAGSTLESMTNTLGFSGLTDTEINESYRFILETFNTLDPKVKLQIANSIWCRNTFSMEQPFVATNQQYFNAEVTPLDFSSPTAVKVINDWVKVKTNELIPEIIEVIPVDAVMYLINAVYFKGQWKYQFNKEETLQNPFYLANGTEIQVASMVQHESFRYFKGSGFEALELPYNQGNYSMTVLLPDANKTVSDIIPLLSQANWETWSAAFQEKDIQLQLPKFKYKYDEKQMIPILSGMGMGEAFDEYKANFTRINANGGLYISRVIHKTFIETNEEGSEAAAATLVELRENSIGTNAPYFFTVNRPFIYFIQEKSTGTILFIGVVMNPSV